MSIKVIFLLSPNTGISKCRRKSRVEMNPHGACNETPCKTHDREHNEMCASQPWLRLQLDFFYRFGTKNRSVIVAHYGEVLFLKIFLCLYFLGLVPVQWGSVWNPRVVTSPRESWLPVASCPPPRPTPQFNFMLCRHFCCPGCWPPFALTELAAANCPVERGSVGWGLVWRNPP